MTATQRIQNPTVRLVTEASTRAPSVWLLLGDLAGDNAQVLALGRALGWPYVVKHVKCARPKSFFRPDPLPRLMPGEGPLVGPWPDLLIAIGGRGARVGHWIKSRSGGRTRHVQLGKIFGPYDRFDLIVSTPQYELPPAGNLMPLILPIGHVDQEAGANAARLWEPQWSLLPRPWIGVLVGGPSSPVTFTATDAQRLLEQATDIAAKAGGSLLMAGGPRTPPAVLEVLKASTFANARLYPFQRGPDNPYPALPALCDRFIVTSDSVSMLADACWSGRPVALFELPVAHTQRRSIIGRWMMRRRRRTRDGLPPDLLDGAYDWLVRTGWRGAGREPALMNRIKSAGWVQVLGAPPAEAASPREQMIRDINRVLQRVRSLMAAT